MKTRQTIICLAGLLSLGGLLALAGGLGACKPKTTMEKVEDKVQDAGHEMHQGMDRAADKVEKAVK
ncbi:MAG: hypothetical protein HY928_06895 [Elusimicrobia bacterium]|nr:hypothetical protein [Elusimicrobiota bacterium]